MKTKSRAGIIIFLICAWFLVLFFGFSCKKYEEGPLISLRSAENRVLGAYRIQSYTINQQDAMSMYSDSLGEFFEFYLDRWNYIESFRIIGYSPNVIYSIAGGTWELSDRNRMIRMNNQYGPEYGPFGGEKLVDWTIIKLKDRNMKLATEYLGNIHEIELIGI